MPADQPTITLPVDTAQHHYLLTLDQVDDLNRHAHRIVLYGTLMGNVLESDTLEPEKDMLVQGVAELVETIIADAEAIKALIAAAKKGGA